MNSVDGSHGTDGTEPVGPASRAAAARLPGLEDMDRARAFYSEKLGLEPSEERPRGPLYHGALTGISSVPSPVAYWPR